MDNPKDVQSKISEDGVHKLLICISDLKQERKRLRHTLGEIKMRVGQRKDNGDAMTVTAIAIELSDLALADKDTTPGLVKKGVCTQEQLDNMVAGEESD